MANKLSDASLCIHAGEDRHRQNTGLTTPIVQTSVFSLASLDEMRKIAEGNSSAYLYTRYANPTTRAAEVKLAALEGADDCVRASSVRAPGGWTQPDPRPLRLLEVSHRGRGAARPATSPECP